VEHLTTAHGILIGSLGLLLYTYVGYPILLMVLAWFRSERSTAARDPVPWPTVSVVVSALNEEAVIGRRIDNLLDLDYPSDRLQIVIGSDGSTDRTGEIVRRYRTPRVRFHDFPLRRGKANVLNDLVRRATGDYVVFTDANTLFDRQAVKELIRGFRSHPSACAVVGWMECRTPEGTANLEGVYWRYETALKRLESRFGTVLGANGPIYAIERAKFRPLPPDTIVDDFLLPMLMRLDGGGSAVFRPSAKAWETVAATVRDEFRRRVRIGAGDIHALRHTWRLLLPSQGMFAVSYWSHKVLRWMGPWLLIGTFVSSLWLVDRAWSRALLGAQLLAYGMGLAVPLFGRVPVIGRMAIAAWFFIVLNAAILIGTVKFLTGRAAPTWLTTPRTAEIRSITSALGARVQAVPEGREERPAA